MSWQLPEPFRKHVEDLDKVARMLLRRGNYSDAMEIHEIRYQLIIDREALENKRLHKGSPLYQIAYCLIAKNKQSEALEYLLKSYVEDILSEDEIEMARQFAASMMLTNYYQFDTTLLERLESFVLKHKGKNNFNTDDLLVPFLSQENIARSALIKYAKATPQITFIKYSMDDIPSAKEKRVFVGGTYGNRFIIDTIENILNELKFQPIIADQFTPREGASDRDHCFELLENCSFAIFEISVPDGWGPEVERANTKNIPLICLYQGDKPSRLISNVVKGYPNEGWKTPDGLKDTIKTFLGKYYKGS